MGKILSLSEIGGSKMEKVVCMCFFIKAFPKLFIFCGDMDNGLTSTVYWHAVLWISSLSLPIFAQEENKHQVLLLSATKEVLISTFAELSLVQA